MFETRSHSWREAGLMRQLDARAIKRARARGLLFMALFVAIIVVNDHYTTLLGKSFPATPVHLAAVIAVLILGWAIALDVGKFVGPTFFRRMDPGTAGTVGFFTRLVSMGIVLLVALRIVGVNSTSLTLGASFAAVIFGLAAQQTLGNVIAGTVLLSARPFRVGERVRLQAGGVGGQVEGVVSSLGLLYTSFASGDDLIMVPNSVVLNSVVIPLREPDAVDLRARLRPGVTPGELQRLLEQSLRTKVRGSPRIDLEELDGEEVVVRITATPQIAADGPALATEVLSIVSRETRAAEERSTAERGARTASAPAGDGGALGRGEDSRDGQGPDPSDERPTRVNPVRRDAGEQQPRGGNGAARLPAGEESPREPRSPQEPYPPRPQGR